MFLLGKYKKHAKRYRLSHWLRLHVDSMRFSTSSGSVLKKFIPVRFSTSSTLTAYFFKSPPQERLGQMNAIAFLGVVLGDKSP